jgi:cytochrome P450
LLFGDLPPEEKTIPRLVAEGQTVIAAGQVTTADYLKKTSYHLISNPSILAKLRQELESVMPEPDKLPPCQTLEQLPYLTAVVNEGFRISYGVTHRLQRVSPDEDLRFQDWVIPKGTPVGMTSIFMHDNEERFPNPKVFDPERWTQGEKSRNLERYLVNFSKGTRGCLGMNLAKVEIYMCLAAVFRGFDMELFETTRTDVEVAHDFFNPQSRKGSKGVRVHVK